MNTTHADITEGGRFDITVEFVTRRIVRRGEDSVHRLLFTDSCNTQFAVLTTPDSSDPVGLRAGETYHLYGLLGADPAGPSGPIENGIDCPACGTPVRSERVLDAADIGVSEAATQLGLAEPFGVFDGRTCLRDSPAAVTSVDNWMPMHADESTGRLEMFCPSCNQRVVGATDRADGQGPSQRVTPSQVEPTDVETEPPAAGEEPSTTGFRANIASGYTPQPATVRDCALLCEPHIAAGDRMESDGMLSPRVGAGVSEHPITGETERYLSVSLDTTLEGPAFVRPRLDMVVALDISGSMERPVDSYPHGSDRGGTTKLERASGALGALARQLGEDDRLGIVLCNQRAHVARPLRAVGDVDPNAVVGPARDVDAGGATNLSEGCETALGMFPQGHDGRSERRVVLLSDLLANAGTTAAEDLAATFVDASTRGIHATALEVGLDANAELAARLAEVRGASRCFVSPTFERRLDGALSRLFTPVVYDLTVELGADGYEIAAVHGCPPATAATDRLAHAGTMFSSVSDDVARSGPVLVRVTRTSSSPEPEPELRVSWTERGGSECTERIPVDIPDDTGRFTDDGVRTAVALNRCGRELRSWAANRHERAETELGESVRQGVPLAVSTQQDRRFGRLRAYLENEMEQTATRRLQREIDLLDVLSRRAQETQVEIVD